MRSLGSERAASRNINTTAIMGCFSFSNVRLKPRPASCQKGDSITIGFNPTGDECFPGMIVEPSISGPAVRAQEDCRRSWEESM